MSHDPNSPEAWNEIWSVEGENTWRTYPLLYDRIVQLVPRESKVLDIGCGVGKLLDRLRAERGCATMGVDTSRAAIERARKKGHDVYEFTLTARLILHLPRTQEILIATEMLEHLPKETLDAFLYWAEQLDIPCIFAVPNDCMGPDVEPQHHHQWTAIAFKRLLESHFRKNVRVECLDDGAPRLLGVCNMPKPYKLAFTMPVKNEAHDIERVLKSFRGVADHMVIGVDDTSTDTTVEIARKYAEEVFSFTWKNDFAAARNVCIDHCKKYGTRLLPTDWIFMSEGHEHLYAGQDELLHLDQVPLGIHVIETRREDRNHAWMFPWLFRARPDINFENAVHNVLTYDENKSQVAQMPSIRTWHERHDDNARERTAQRKGMNRFALAKQLKDNPDDARSCFYLANEWRKTNPGKAADYYERYLLLDGKNGPERYQARLSLAECLFPGLEEARAAQRYDDVEKIANRIYDTLIVATSDDWSRCEHWLLLGDLCWTAEPRREQALRFYELAATSIGREPITYMWLNKHMYTWMPAQKLVTAYAHFGMLKDALHWCDRYLQLIPEWAPNDVRDEITQNRATIIARLEEPCPSKIPSPLTAL